MYNKYQVKPMIIITLSLQSVKKENVKNNKPVNSRQLDIDTTVHSYLIQG